MNSERLGNTSRDILLVLIITNCLTRASLRVEYIFLVTKINIYIYIYIHTHTSFLIIKKREKKARRLIPKKINVE
jgi:hypothetical protein